jgi:catechol 2,3-dioxygenase-like lactoylglutathione lyase family enzyme
MKMMTHTRVFVLLVWASGIASPAAAQLLTAKDNPIVYGHHHLNATSIDAHKKFWADTLGGKADTFGPQKAEMVKFPNVLLFMRAQPPTGGGSKGSTVNHIGFSVTNLREALARVRANGYPIITREEVASPEDVKDDMLQFAGTTTLIAFVMAPDAVKVELVENRQQDVPIMLHHVHFFGPQNAEMQAWYAKVFGAAARPARPGAAFVSATLPGVTLNFSPSPEPVSGTAGRSFDHIGFEVQNLEEFCRRLEAQGITLNVGYRRVDAWNLAVAFITDPWGTNIELNEGLDRVD